MFYARTLLSFLSVAVTVATMSCFVDASNEEHLKQQQAVFDRFVRRCIRDIVDSDSFYLFEWEQIVLFCNKSPRRLPEYKELQGIQPYTAGDLQAEFFDKMRALDY